MDAMLIGVAVALAPLIATVIAAVAHEQRRVRNRWRDTATTLGLQFDEGGLTRNMSMSGHLDGIAVKVKLIQRSVGDSSEEYTAVEARPNVPPPSGLRFHHEGLAAWFAKALGGQDIPLAEPLADEKLRVQGDDPEAVKAILDHPAAASALRAVVQSENKNHTQFNDGTLTLEVLGKDAGKIGAMVRDAVDAVGGLDTAARAPWRALAEERGLLHEETRTSGALDGTLRGLPVLVRVRYSDHHARTSVRVTLDGGLPGHVRIRAGEGGVPIGDPILDGRVIVESRTTARDGPHDAAVAWLRERLADEEHDLRGCLMDVLQGLPDALIEDGVVQASLPGRLGPELAETLDRLVDLGKALSLVHPPDTDDEAHRRATGAAHATRQSP